MRWVGGGHCRSGPRRGRAVAGSAGSGHLAAAETVAVVSDRREVRQRGRSQRDFSDSPESEPGSVEAAQKSHLRSRSRRQ